MTNHRPFIGRSASAEREFFSSEEEPYVQTLRDKITDLKDQLTHLASIVEMKEMRIYEHCAADGCQQMRDPRLTTLPLCWVHLNRAAHDEYLAREAEIRGDGVTPPYLVRVEREQILPEKIRAWTQSVVYYIKINDHIKIGTTSGLRQRVETFHVLPSAVLAVEPGDYSREAQRHREFSHLRYPRTELFTPESDLLERVAATRQMFGDPAQFL